MLSFDYGITKRFTVLEERLGTQNQTLFRYLPFSNDSFYLPLDELRSLNSPDLHFSSTSPLWDKHTVLAVYFFPHLVGQMAPLTAVLAEEVLWKGNEKLEGRSQHLLKSELLLQKTVNEILVLTFRK